MCSLLIDNPFVLRMLGIISVFFISLLMSENRNKINWISSLCLLSSIFILAYLLVSFNIGILLVDCAVKVF